MRIIRNDGTVIECTTEEYKILFLGVPEYSEHTTTPEVDIARPVKSSHKHWKRKDKILLKKNGHLSLRALTKMFPGRSSEAIKIQIRNLGVKKKYKRVLNPNNKNIKRLGFINHTAYDLISKLGISRKEAWKRASDKYNNHKNMF